MTRTRTTFARVLIAVFGLAAVSAPAIVATTPRAAADDGTTVRPISDFIDRQALTYRDENGRSHSDFVYWNSWNRDGSPEWRARIDFLGVLDRGYIVPNFGGSIGTTFSGQVTEHVQADGRTLVHVQLHTSNAFCVVSHPVFVSKIYWGKLAPAARGAGGGLAAMDTVDVHFDLRYLTADQPGADMPHLWQLQNKPREDQEVLQQTMTAEGTGRLRVPFGVADGTPGRVTITQTYVNSAGHPSSAATADSDEWPVARIDLRVVGSR